MKLCIKNLADQNGYTKIRLAKELNMSRQYAYSLYDGSVKSIKIENIEKLCEIFHCTPNDLFVGLEDLSFLNHKTHDELPDDFITDEEVKMTRDASPKNNSSENIVDDYKNNIRISNIVYEIINNDEFKNLVDQHIKEAIETEKSSKNSDIFDNDEWNQW